ncbi:unnamed protein product [Coregonus sp. 'balchen']|nr:unnamed protein product [Coregonus sp. 'balchen']
MMPIGPAWPTWYSQPYPQPYHCAPTIVGVAIPPVSVVDPSIPSMVMEGEKEKRRRAVRSRSKRDPNSFTQKYRRLMEVMGKTGNKIDDTPYINYQRFGNTNDMYKRWDATDMVNLPSQAIEAQTEDMGTSDRDLCQKQKYMLMFHEEQNSMREKKDEDKMNREQDGEKTPKVRAVGLKGQHEMSMSQSIRSQVKSHSPTNYDTVTTVGQAVAGDDRSFQNYPIIVHSQQHLVSPSLFNQAGNSHSQCPEIPFSTISLSEWAALMDTCLSPPWPQGSKAFVVGEDTETGLAPAASNDRSTDCHSNESRSRYVPLDDSTLIDELYYQYTCHRSTPFLPDGQD